MGVFAWFRPLNLLVARVLVMGAADALAQSDSSALSEAVELKQGQNPQVNPQQLAYASTSMGITVKTVEKKVKTKIGGK